jgi:hemoglobin
MTDQTLFEKYGGFSRISKVVLSFYDTLLDSEQIGPFFDDIDMSRMVDHQTKFIASLLGGPASYTDNQIRQFHARLDIENAHFDELKEILAATLAGHGFDAQDIEAVLDAFEQRRVLVVG